MKSLQQRVAGLDGMVSAYLGGASVTLRPIIGTVPVIEIIIGGREELPVFITASESQVLCICYLWTDAEIIPSRRIELLELMLDLNLSVPLSSFGRVDDRYVLFGALAHDAKVEDVAKDVAALSDNALDALDALAEYLLD